MLAFDVADLVDRHNADMLQVSGGPGLDVETLDHLLGYTKSAARLGFTTLCANDHLVFSVPWLDGPTALAVAIRDSGTMTLATTVALAVVRGPVPVAKALGGIDRLSGGRALVVVGPGSSPQDYESVGVDFEERWQRLDEAVLAWV